ncbi:MerR family transcriptional regulator [Microbulbifer yueqingensis]|uniref:Transcriptional regulator, MerR family n=1 Tax=Microbulbifer yueqingensis TaxID=658219 RepID=A0A1G9CPM6_9GAMM|nr:MerR family DNA-binding transcriptional regulator [Microbulbifer yueqingensis]SDK53650.1 transcriptional regulator, MerR family [Microbulbifer yueqingensis]
MKTEQPQPQPGHESGPEPDSYSISDLAREFGITTRAIRFYEDKGLLSPARRGQTRIYSPEDRVRLMLILRGKRLGFSLDESREIIDMYDPEHGNVEQLQRLLQHIEQKRAQLQQQLRDIQSLMGELDEAEARTRASLAQTQEQ